MYSRLHSNIYWCKTCFFIIFLFFLFIFLFREHTYLNEIGLNSRFKWVRKQYRQGVYYVLQSICKLVFKSCVYQMQRIFFWKCQNTIRVCTYFRKKRILNFVFLIIQITILCCILCIVRCYAGDSKSWLCPLFI